MTIWNIQPGDMWYVKRPMSLMVEAADIVEVTTGTVLVKIGACAPIRYEITDIRWIERLREAP